MTITKYNEIAKKQGAKIFLTIGEDQTKMKCIQIKKSINNLKKRKLKYSSGYGEEELLHLIAESENVNLENIIITQGSTLGIFYSLFLFDKKGYVQIYKPYYPMYKEILDILKIETKYVNLERYNFKLTYKVFLKTLNKNTKYIILNNPHNPTGQVIDDIELSKIVEYCESNNIYLILDEVYEYLTYVDFKKNFYKNEKYIIHIKSFSKTFNMTGVRLGYVVASKQNIDFFHVLIKNSLVSVPTILQDIGVSSIKNFEKTHKNYNKQREIIKDFLDHNELKYCPLDSTFYAFVSIKEFDMTSFDFAMELIHNTQIAVLPSSIFGIEGYIRISYACDITILKSSLIKMENYFKSLK